MDKIYIISKYITFVGAILKGFWEHLFCRLLGIPVQDARYLQANELCGHVDHDFTKDRNTTFFLCWLPGVMNRVFGYGMLIGGYLGLFVVRAGADTPIFWIYSILFYLGVSLICNNAPLYEDALNNWDLVYGKDKNTNIIIKALAFLPSVYFLASAWLEKYAISLLLCIIATVIGIVL